MKGSRAGNWMGLAVGVALLAPFAVPVALIGPRAMIAGLRDMPADPEVPGGRVTALMAFGFVLCLLVCACALTAWSAANLRRHARSRPPRDP